jgi:hypothetical protein
VNEIKELARDIVEGIDSDDPPQGGRRIEVDETGREWLVIRGPRIAGQPRAEFWLPEKDPAPE